MRKVKVLLRILLHLFFLGVIVYLMVTDDAKSYEPVEVSFTRVSFYVTGIVINIGVIFGYVYKLLGE